MASQTQTSRLPHLLPKVPPSTADATAAGSGSSANPRKRLLAAAACAKCRKRKIRCDERRPKCTACTAVGYDCDYEYAQGVSSRRGKDESYKKCRQKISQFNAVFELLRSKSEEESCKTLEIIRRAETIEEGVSVAAGARILLSAGGRSPHRSYSSEQPRAFGPSSNRSDRASSSSTSDISPSPTYDLPMTNYFDSTKTLTNETLPSLREAVLGYPHKTISSPRRDALPAKKRIS